MHSISSVLGLLTARYNISYIFLYMYILFLLNKDAKYGTIRF